MTIEKARKILGEKVVSLTDEEVRGLIGLVKLFLDMYEKQNDIATTT